MSDLLLEVRGLSKSFPGVRALAGVDFTVKRGQIHALMARERRWEEHADQGADWCLRAGCGRESA